MLQLRVVNIMIIEVYINSAGQEFEKATDVFTWPSSGSKSSQIEGSPHGLFSRGHSCVGSSRRYLVS